MAIHRGEPAPLLPVDPGDIIISRDGEVYWIGVATTDEEIRKAEETALVYQMRQDWLDELAFAKQDLIDMPECLDIVLETIKECPENTSDL